jgi:hypothetical protein
MATFMLLKIQLSYLPGTDHQSANLSDRTQSKYNDFRELGRSSRL